MSTTAQTYYSAARDEIILRLRMRDTILLAYTVASGSILGVSISNLSTLGPTIALIIPFLAIGSALLVSAHSIAITALGRYTNQLKPAIDECRANPNIEVEPWDYSRTYMNYAKRHSISRLRGHVFIIQIPAFAALLVAFANFCYPFDLFSVFWLIGLALTLFSIWELIKAHIERQKETRQRLDKYSEEHIAES